MNIQEFKEYMEKNIYYNYLYRYYNSIDIASVYGVDKMEIKHSNFLKWLIQPKDNTDNIAIEYLPIRNLLKLLQNNNKYYDCLKEINIDKANIKDVQVLREKFNIDLLISLKIDSEDYIIIIENKLESLIHDNQLEEYRKKIESKFSKVSNRIFAFLHPGYQINPEQESIVENAEYIPITYQEIYDNILKEFVELSTDPSIKFIVYYYIHSLSSYSSDALSGGLIVTDEEKKCLESLFKDDEIIKMINSLYNNENNSYREYYNQNKAKFMQLFNKYLNITTEQDDLHNKIKDILISKSYIFNGESYIGVGTLLSDVFKSLLNYHSIEDISQIINLYPESDPLLVEEDNLKDVNHIYWYTRNEKKLPHNDKVYYVLSAWASKEYEELKERINKLKKINPNVYGNITLE